MSEHSARSTPFPAGTVLLFALLVVAGLRPSMLKLILPVDPAAVAPGPSSGVDRRPLRLHGDPGQADVVRFVEGVRQETPRGATIALLFPPPFDGFSYAYWRAAYLLSGRTVLLPLTPPPIGEAEYVAVMGVPFADPRFEHMWSGGRGETLWRRR